MRRVWTTLSWLVVVEAVDVTMHQIPVVAQAEVVPEVLGLDLH